MAEIGISLEGRRKHIPPQGAADDDTFPPKASRRMLEVSPFNIRR